MSDKDYSPHECWCDTQNNISDRCNCMVSTYIEKIEDMQARIEMLETALRFYADEGKYDYDRTQGVNYIWNDLGKTAREALEG